MKQVILNEDEWKSLISVLASLCWGKDSMRTVIYLRDKVEKRMRLEQKEEPK